jgi:hypothetical protein
VQGDADTHHRQHADNRERSVAGDDRTDRGRARQPLLPSGNLFGHIEPPCTIDSENRR